MKSNLSCKQIDELRHMIANRRGEAHEELRRAEASLAEWTENETKYRAEYGEMYSYIDGTERDRVEGLKRKIAECNATEDELVRMWYEAYREAAARIQ